MKTLITEYQRYLIPREQKSYEGLDAWNHSLQGFCRRLLKTQGSFLKRASRIHHLCETLSEHEDEKLYSAITEFRLKFRAQPSPSRSILDEALAHVCECCHRTKGMRPYPVQIMGVLAQFEGYLIEMKTGEGKTLVAGLTAVLAGWSGRPCHVVTSNDYLASRDAESMQPLFSLCQLGVAAITGEMGNEERRVAYDQDIVYATSKELLADFLRDRMGQEDLNWDKSLIRSLRQDPPKPMVMRGLHTAIIDEADSVLADEATTPLIISVPSQNDLLKEASHLACDIATKMKAGEHYTINERFQDIRLTDEGERFVEQLVQPLPKMWQAPERRQFLVHQALAAREFFHKDHQYVIDEEEGIVIVDEATGRIMEHRSWSAGLHQAIEAKEGLELSDPTETHTRMSFQRFFRLYRRLSGMSGTLQNLQEELWQIYRLPVLQIPKRINRHYTMQPVRILATLEDKWGAVQMHIRDMHRKRRPVLVGTRSVEESVELAQQLRASGLDCVVLNALEHDKEAHIISQAGEAGRITIATNMAGRGTDIHIGREAENLGGLHVVATEHFESVRVDRQFYGRTARQGQPGSVQLFLSLEDELLIRHCPLVLRKTLQKFLWAPWASFAARLVWYWIQRKIERRTSGVRRRILNRDFSLNEMLSFSRK